LDKEFHFIIINFNQIKNKKYDTVGNEFQKTNRKIPQTESKLCHVIIYKSKFFIQTITKPDLNDPISCKNLCGTLNELCRLKIIPILNTNDAVAPPPAPEKNICLRKFYAIFQ
jgi:hypothetical protein